jgi:ketosteroid isomerase-like protein
MSRTARETVEQFVSAPTTLADRGDLADFYAEDAVVEIMFAPPGVATRTQGREVLRARFTASTAVLAFDEVVSAVLHQTDDPEVVIAEYGLRGHVVETGKEFVFQYVMVIRVRDGLIIHSRDYFNPLAAQEARS